MKLSYDDIDVKRYAEQVKRYPLLTREQEYDFAVKAKAGDEDARTALIHANLRYAVAIAYNYRRYGIKMSDLIAESNLGLMMAVRKFDPAHGTRFVTYAGYWVRAYVLDLVVRSTTMVGAGSGPLRTKLFFRLRRERARIANIVEEPEEQNAELARVFNTTPEKMAAMSNRLDARDVSLDVQIQSDSDTTLLDTLVADEPTQDEQLFSNEKQAQITQKLHGAMGQLDRRERFILESRFMGDDEVSLAAIGRKLGISRERARQLESRAKQKVKHHLHDEEMNYLLKSA